MGKAIIHPIPDDPTEALLKEKCVRTKAQKAWMYFCTLLQFWTDLVTTESGEILYGGRRQPANPMIKQIRAMLNPSFGSYFKITWASIATSTSWRQARLYYGDADRARFQSEPGPTTDIQNRLEKAVEERWEKYLREGEQETPDLSFSTPSWAGTSSRLQYSAGQPEPRHPTESESIPPGFTRHNRKTHEEQEATSRYQTPAEENATPGTEVQQTIDEELGAEDVTTLGNDWFPPSESEVTEAVQNLLNLQTPMDVDPPPEERSYQFFHAEEAEALGPYQEGPGLPVTAEENRVLNTPGGFPRAPGDGRPPSGCTTGLPGRRITGRTKE